MNIISEMIKQLFCKHEWYEYNCLNTCKNHPDGYKERWLICRKCSDHKIIKIYKEAKI